ncbi:D-alanine--D-alanine ligase [Polaribacter pacificus]|uniref:D-alanine--D-alanine ligase n=2 Tax=Polaribacter pacificus TaxID=1775173 RepID=A0A917MEJ2_9FLAO|nr:D-alanine--D-alanine ligase [Polaribacter pacificus]
MFYIPNIPFAFYHAIKARNLVFYTAVNPSIANSGIGTESKYETQKLIPAHLLPSTVLHTPENTINETLTKLKEKKITFPMIAKPDIGFRGMLVQKINSETALIDYLNKYPINILIQEFLTEPHECGIFYHRFPGTHQGTISSITLKDFLTVVGDGQHSVLELIEQHPRAQVYLDLLTKNNEIAFDTILEIGEKLQLTEIGNHSKGTQFINGNHLINNKLELIFTQLNKQIKGWYYGRLDIKYSSIEALEQGQFKVLELNGILAEPTHMYDANSYTYFKALKEMRKHWKQLYLIARYNHDVKKVPYRSVTGLLKDVRALIIYTKSLAKLHQFTPYS